MQSLHLHKKWTDVFQFQLFQLENWGRISRFQFYYIYSNSNFQHFRLFFSQKITETTETETQRHRKYIGNFQIFIQIFTKSPPFHNEGLSSFTFFILSFLHWASPYGFSSLQPTSIDGAICSRPCVSKPHSTVAMARTRSHHPSIFYHPTEYLAHLFLKAPIPP